MLIYTTVSNRSYVVGLNILDDLVESENPEDQQISTGNVRFVVKSSYGKDIYTEVCKPENVANAVYRFLEAVYLRDKFARVLNESVDSDRWGEILSDIDEYTRNIGGKDSLKISYSEDNSKPLEITIKKGTDDKVFNDVKKYIIDTYKDEVNVTDIDDSSFLLK